MGKLCTVDGCAGTVNARGLCGKHYTRAQKAGLFGSPCTVDGCNKPRVGGGLCATHYKQKWASKNREQTNARQREYLKVWRVTSENPQKRRERGERHRRNNLAVFADKERIRRAKKRGNGGSYRVTDWRRLLNRFSGMCAYCTIRKATTADHVVPLAKGGSNYIGNILPACGRCNSSKQDKLLIEWRNNRVGPN